MNVTIHHGWHICHGSCLELAAVPLPPYAVRVLSRTRQWGRHYQEEELSSLRDGVDRVSHEVEAETKLLHDREETIRGIQDEQRQVTKNKKKWYDNGGVRHAAAVVCASPSYTRWCEGALTAWESWMSFVRRTRDPCRHSPEFITASQNGDRKTGLQSRCTYFDGAARVAPSIFSVDVVVPAVSPCGRPLSSSDKTCV